MRASMIRQIALPIFFLLFISSCQESGSGTAAGIPLPDPAVSGAPPSEKIFDTWTFKATTDESQSNCPKSRGSQPATASGSAPLAPSGSSSPQPSTLAERAQTAPVAAPEASTNTVQEEYRIVKREGGCAVSIQQEDGTRLTTGERFFRASRTTCRAGDTTVTWEQDVSTTQSGCTIATRTVARLALGADDKFSGTAGGDFRISGRCPSSVKSCQALASVEGRRGRHAALALPQTAGEAERTPPGTGSPAVGTVPSVSKVSDAKEEDARREEISSFFFPSFSEGREETQ